MSFFAVNKIECVDALAFMRSLPDACVDLVLTDPPYYRVKAEAWDRAWPTPAAFIAWLSEIADEWRRVLKPNGSLYCFASTEMAARVEVMLADRFNVLNRITWAKPAYSTKAEMNATETQRAYFPTSEAVLFCEQIGADSQAKGEAGYEAACEGAKTSVIGAYLRAEFGRAGVTSKQIAALFPSRTGGLTGCVSNWLLGYNIPTPDQYAEMREFCNAHGGDYLRREYEDLRREYEDLRREYEDLRREYEDLRRPFTVSKSVPYTDVWHYRTEPHGEGKHPCEKPYRMAEDIVLASSRPGGVVLDTFCGSGVFLQAAKANGRAYLGCDADPRWVEVARKRAEGLIKTAQGRLL